MKSLTWLVCFFTGAGLAPRWAEAAPSAREVDALRRALHDLRDTFGSDYPNGDRYLRELQAVEAAGADQRFQRLKREALLANPLLQFDRLLLVRRRFTSDKDLGVPSNGSSNSELTQKAFDNEIAVLSPVRPEGKLTTLFRPADNGFVGEVDLHWDARRLIFSHSNQKAFRVWEMGVEGSGRRQVSQTPPDVDCYDPCYLPNGQIVFGCTASYQSVPCFHGIMPACHLYVMDPDGGNMRQLCFDQDLDLHPTVLNNGQVLYNRWDYTGINHVFMRQLMVMNPDGSGQRAVYGSNLWFPNALYYPQAIPGRPDQLVAVLTGYHQPRMGWLVVVDLARPEPGGQATLHRLSGRGTPLRPRVADTLTLGEWPQFLNPFPLADSRGRGAGKYFLVSAWPDRKRPVGVYLADIFDNLVLLHEEPGHALLEPIPVVPRPRPPVVRGALNPAHEEATVYLHDVYAGPGLAGVPRGTVKSLRVLSYNFGYRGLAGPDKIGYGGPWEVMRIEGTVPVETDGSAVFRVPAQTPLAVQPLDAEGQALQLMRSWFTAMPGETVSCVGCHETNAEAVSYQQVDAARRAPRSLTPWYGPPRGFSFEREVQPVLDRYCTACHDGRPQCPDLRSAAEAKQVKAWPIGYRDRLHSDMKRANWQARFSPAYDALVRQIRRVGIEDDVSLLTPGEYHADTSPLVQLLRKGHHGVRLDRESWDRIVTWIDLNAPFHGSWSEVFSPVPGKAAERRLALRKLYGGPLNNPENDASLRPAVLSLPALPPRKLPLPSGAPRVPDWPFQAQRAQERQAALGPAAARVDLGEGVELRLVRIPAGAFVMGDPVGEPDEQPPTAVQIERPFWMGAFEVTNAQLRRFAPAHDSHYYAKRYPKRDSLGLSLNEPTQPAVRVSWEQAQAFCDWLTQRTGQPFALPTEAQWEWACRAGAATPLWFGSPETDFSHRANLGDKSFSVGGMKNGGQNTGGLTHFLLEGAALADARFDDGAKVTAPVGQYQPNPWGLYDMHGNAAEWTRTTYRPYPYREDDGRNAPDAASRKVVRGGSFFDSPSRSRSAFRLGYPQWQRVFNVGFRVVCNTAAGLG